MNGKKFKALQYLASFRGFGGCRLHSWW